MTIARNLKFAAALGMSSAVALAVAAPAYAKGEAEHSYNIQAQPLANALVEFSKQSGVVVTAPARLTRGKSAPSVKGSYKVDQGLRLLLAGSGLVAKRSGSGFVIARGERQEAADTDSASSNREDAIAGSAATDHEGVEDAKEIVVTGTNIRGVDVPAPTITVDRDEFANSGFSTIEDVFENLPQNFDEVTPEGRFANEGGSQLRGLNNSRVSAVDLRGLGAQSTLTLLNGTRRAGSIGGRVVDISVIPLSIIERVEIVTGGRSAIYGADAVAGVVNMVTRRTFDGAESQAYFGFADGGGERLQLSQIVGSKGDHGGIVAAYDFARDWPLNLADAGLLSLMPNPDIGLTQLSLNAQADTWRHSGFLSGRYELGDRVELVADGLYSHKTFEDFALRFFDGATENSFTDTRNKAKHLNFSGGAHIDVGADWKLKLSGGWSSAKNEQESSLFIDLGFFSLTRDNTSASEATVTTVSAVADGPLFSIAGITPRAALGVEWRREGFKNSFNDVQDFDGNRKVRSAFAELFFPLVQNSDTPGLRTLEVTLAGRYDDYSDFGGTFNPQVGVSWEPFRGLAVRGAYSTAFRAPALIELSSSVDAFLELASDPNQGGANVPVLFVQGESSALQPEEAETWSLGFDFEPSFAPWLRTSFSYFDVRYDGRIEQPSVNADRELVLERADRFPGLIIRNPSAADAGGFLDLDADDFISNDTGTPFDAATQNILDVFPNLVLFDNRTTNIAVEKVRGLDFTVDTEFDTRIGTLNFGVNLTHTLDHDRSVTATSPAFSLLNEVGKPVDTRIRGKAGWTQGPYSAFAYVNYVDDYTNPFSTPPSRMEPWTTVDLTLRFNGNDFANSRFLKGFDATLSVRNLFDNDPPFFPNSLQGVLYDSANASPLGRFTSLRLTKRW